MADPSAITMPRAQRTLRWFVRFVWLGSLTLLILVALYVGLGRQVMDNLHHFKSELEHKASVVVGQPVSIERIHGEWRGLDPILRVSGVELAHRDDGRTVASLGQLRVRLDSWASLQRFRLVFSEFSLRDADASLVQQRDGRIGIEGVWLPPERETEPYGLPEVAAAASESFEARFGRWIRELGDVFSNPAARIENLKLRVNPAGAEASDFVVPQMDLRFEDDIFSASGRLIRSGDEGRASTFILRGRHFFSGGFTGRVYTELNSSRFFDAFLRHYDWRNVSVVGLKAEARAWLQFADGRMISATGRVTCPFLQMRANGTDMDPQQDLSMIGTWQRNGAQWQGRVSASGFKWGKYETQSTGARIRRDANGIKVRVQGLDIAPVRDLVSAMGLLPVALQKELLGYQPRGRVRNLYLSLPDDQQWHVRGQLEGFGMQAYQGKPAITGLSGFFDVDAGGGRLTVRPGAMELGFPDLFTESWDLSRFIGTIRWERRGRGWWLRSDNLLARYGSALIEADFGLRLREEDDTLALRVGLANADSGMLGLLVPGPVVPDRIYELLSENVSGGRISHGWYYGYGSIRSGEPHSAFSSAFKYHFENADITYSPEWPALEEVTGTVRFQPSQGIVKVDSARIGGIDLQPSTARFGWGNTGFRVDLDAALRREGAILTRQWRETSPLPDIFGDWIRDFRLEGPAEAALSASLWPREEREPQLELNLDLKGASLRYLPAGLSWGNLTGPVRYRTGEGFDTTTLEARFLGSPVAISVRDKPDRAPVIRQRGGLAVNTLKSQSGSGLPGLRGDLDYAASLRPTQGPRLRLDADLTEIGSDWPSPLSKGIGESHSLTAEVDFSTEGRLIVAGHWHPLGAFRMAFQNLAFERGRFALGARSAGLPEDTGLYVTGAVPVLDVTEWHQAINRMPSSEASPADAMQSVRLNLAIDELRIGDRAMGSVGVRGGTGRSGEWRVALQGERIAGNISVPADDGPDQVVLENLDIPERNSPEQEAASSSSGSGLPPSSWPYADVSINNFRFEGRNFRQVDFRVRRADNDIAIQSLQASMGELDLTGDLIWRPGTESGVTEFEGALEGGSLKGLEALIGETVPIRNKRAQADISLAWPGAPADIELASLSAELDFRLENGTIEQGSEAARLFRVFGLLNTDTLWRRLQLDFSDVYGSGIPFDHMEGSALIHDGKLTLDPKITIQAPSGGFRMSGEADLIEETLDMRLVVVLPITQNLPLAAVLSGFAAPVGGVLFIIDQVFGGVLSRVTSATYSVGGTWDDPDVELRNLFDTESDLEGYDRPDMELDPGETSAPTEEIRR